jgi:hypothetical protein
MHSIFCFCLANRNCQANNHRAPLDATTQVSSKHIAMETTAQSGVRRGANSLYIISRPIRPVGMGTRADRASKLVAQ